MSQVRVNYPQLTEEALERFSNTCAERLDLNDIERYVRHAVDVIEDLACDGGLDVYYMLGLHETKSGHAEQITFSASDFTMLTVDIDWDWEDDYVSESGEFFPVTFETFKAAENAHCKFEHVVSCVSP